MTKKQFTMQHFIMTVFLIVLLGGIMGWIYEMIFYRIDTGSFIKRGQGFGPWLPIYSFGILALIIVTHKRTLSLPVVFLLSMIGSGVIEFIVGFALFHLFDGLRLWDYNVEIWNWGNIGGYVCLRSVLFFGLFGTIFYYFVIPKIFALTEKIEEKILMFITIPLAVFVFCDIVFGYFIKPFIHILS